jgi:hypothetical protein
MSRMRVEAIRAQKIAAAGQLKALRKDLKKAPLCDTPQETRSRCGSLHDGVRRKLASTSG